MGLQGVIGKVGGYGRFIKDPPDTASDARLWGPHWPKESQIFFITGKQFEPYSD